METYEDIMEHINDNGGYAPASDDIPTDNGYKALNPTDWYKVAGIILALHHGVEVDPIIVDGDRKQALTGSHRIHANEIIRIFDFKCNKIEYFDIKDSEFVREYEDEIEDGFWDKDLLDRSIIIDILFQQ